MRRALQGPGVPRWTRRPAPRHWLGPGNTNIRSARLYRLGTRYSTLPVPTHRTYPGYYPSPGTHPPAPPVLPSLLHGAVVMGSTKEILGVDNAHPGIGIAQDSARLTLRPPSPSPLLGLGAGCEAGSWARTHVGL